MSEHLSRADLIRLLSALEELYQPTEADQFAISKEVADPERLVPVIREHVMQNPLSRFVLSGGKAKLLDLRDHISRRDSTHGILSGRHAQDGL